MKIMRKTYSSRRSFRRFFFEISFVAIFPALLLVGCGGANRMDASCVQSPIDSRSSGDGRYTAVIEKMVCESGAETSYKLKIVAKEAPGLRGWNASFSLESDLRDALVPTLEWTSELEVEVSVPTRTIEGELKQNVGDNLTIRRIFVAKSPGTFPNYY
jgi:hypothetical protein